MKDSKIKFEGLSGISVIMPTYNQGSFIARAITSLIEQTFKNWELIIVNDGSTDYTKEIIGHFIQDARIIYLENDINEGLGFSVNLGIRSSKFNLIAYLPSDDIYFKSHLQSLYNKYHENRNAKLIYSGIRFNYQDNQMSSGSSSSQELIEGETLQLVQVLHQKLPCYWMERDELVTDDLEKMFFSKVCDVACRIPTYEVTCEWIEHPEQRHKIIRENENGGINLYKQFYNVKGLIKFHSSVGNFIDEEENFSEFRSPLIRNEQSLKILLVGELAYNAERIIAFEERGHKLYGLWMTAPHCYNTVGPLPFGNIEDISIDNYVEKIAEIKPDLIYALLNYQAVPFAHYIMMQNLGVPFIWHFKEGPFICRENGIWKELMELQINSDAQIYTNPEVRDWFNQFLYMDSSNSFILDGDLPKNNFFTDDRSSLISELDGEIHTVVPGRPLGISPKDVAELAQHKIHFHFYGEFQQSFWQNWIMMANYQAPGYFHLHPNCTPKNWVSELSKYDAGWLHILKSKNQGELLKASWYDLNYAARMTTLAAAGLPMLQMDNSGNISATYSLINKLGMGIDFNDFSELGVKLADKAKVKAIRETVWEKRMVFTFDYHVDDLIAFFRKVMADYSYKKTIEKVDEKI
ncbi:glycosyltransferase family 2 protein [Pedobacter sp. PWIIR3]